MSTATITIFKKTATWKLLPQNLFMLDDIEAYLSAISSSDKITITNFQYIKQQLELTICVDLAQTNAVPVSNFAYVKITNASESHSYYYYIKKIEWRSTSTCKLFLVMDVLNSIKYGDDYVLGPKTKINRQHKNRIVKKTLRDYIYLEIECNATLIDLQNAIGSLVEFTFDDAYVITQVLKGVESPSQEVYRLKFDYDADAYSSFLAEKGRDFELIQLPDTTLGLGTLTLVTYTAQYTYFRKIDLLSEQIPAALYHNSENDESITNPDNDSDWFLIYATENDPSESQVNPLNCFLCTDKNLVVQPNQPIVQGRIYPEMLESNKYYYIAASLTNPSFSLTLTDGTIVTFNSVGGNNDILILYKVDSSLIINKKDRSSSILTTYITDYVSISKTLITSKNTVLQYDSIPSGGTSHTFYLTDYPQVTLDTIDDLDRTISKIVKVIKLPYAPYNFEYTEDDILIIPADWEFGTFAGKNFLKLKDLNTKFSYTFESNVENPNEILKVTSAPDYTQTRNDYFESKIYHSDYFTPKVVYDSFGFIYNMEKIDIASANFSENKLKLTFTSTTTINSRFMITFPQYKCGSLNAQDYNNVMPIIRNNEVSLYNIPYLNYIRNGYNYDVKTKNRQNVANAIGVGLGLAGTLAALAFPASALTVPLVLGMGASTVKSLVSTINTNAQSEQNIQAKLQEAAAQGASISGSDDVDLMSEYTKNRASLLNYRTSNIMHELLLDLFYYTGYTENSMGTPDLTTRKWFNFCACDPHIDAVSGKLVSLSDDVLKELNSLWKSGVTVMHKVNGAYDLLQVKENAEVTIEEI